MSNIMVGAGYISQLSSKAAQCRCWQSHRSLIASLPASRTALRRSRAYRLQAHQVTIEHEGGTTVLTVEDDQSVLEAALDQGLELSHDCKMGVCMTCPARLVSGVVDQMSGMLSEEVKEKGYALLCISYPQTDCSIKIIDEDELLEEVLHGDG